ncbi:hypothetical protein [Actinoplanes sp. NPDC051494]|uniref:hypothetical protein n=1 Tax=Actinoplanes sp. NPDC051494 TaxID=3363907 RepID=UPI0037A80CBC
MTSRVVVVLLTPVVWSPPGVGIDAWRAALAEDVVDLLARLAQAEPAIAAVSADLGLAREIAWPGMPVWEVPSATVLPVLKAAEVAGFDQAAVLAADAADLPGLILGKLLRPLGSKPVAVAPGGGGAGLLALASTLPVPGWLTDHDLDTATPMSVRRGAPQPSLVESTPEWRRIRGAAELATLDVRLEGWENTRAILGG